MEKRRGLRKEDKKEEKMWGKNIIWERKNRITVRIECGERKICGKIIWKKSRKQKKEKLEKENVEKNMEKDNIRKKCRNKREEKLFEGDFF